LSFLVPKGAPDVVVYGLQEVDRRPEAYMAAVKSREEVWTSRLAELLNAQEEAYFKVASQIMVSVMIVVFAKIELADAVSQISTSMASCGILGIVGNKGGVAVRFKVHEDYLCFVNCHLAAHEKQVVRRNQDFADLHDRLLFYSAAANIKTMPKHARLLDPYLSAGSARANLLDSDVVVWLGDFNYRVEMDSERVRTHISQGELDAVIGCDQMLREFKRAGSHFSNYTEAPIAFAPSYSYDVGSDQFDSSDQKRVPSWCDRILWRKDDPIEVKAYDCIMEARSSDHKPVTLIGTATIRKVDRQLFDEAYATGLRMLDSFENAAIPDTRVLSHAIHLGVLRFRKSAHSFIDLENRGKVLAQYRFLAVDPGRGAMPFWMHILEPQGLVLPGSSMPIAVDASYDVEVARQAAARGPRFEAILVLHIEGGKDHFVREILWGRRG
jgi:phosphatidylinositol-bisphosphatase